MIGIDKNIPLPRDPRTIGPGRKYPFDLMGIGDSFFVSRKGPGSMGGCVKLAKTRVPGSEFSCRKVEGGVRVWRTK